MISTYRLFSLDYLKEIAKLIFVFATFYSRYADVCRKTELEEISCDRFSFFSSPMRKKIYCFC